MNRYNLLKISRVVNHLNRSLYCNYSRTFHRLPVCFKSTFFLRNMSQSSIRSFFTVTPKKPAEVETEEQKNKSFESDKVSPPSNGKDKITKRSRSTSTEDEINSNCASPELSEKKKPKRRRIVSSESESDSKSDQEIKLDKTRQPKTYDSPKTKKINKIKTEKLSPVNKKSKEKSENPSAKKDSPKVKKETVTSPRNKKEEIKSPPDKKKIASLFAKKTDLEVEDKENSTVEKEKTAEVDYNPAKPKYHPIKDACWNKGQEVPYLALAKTLENIEATSARLKMIDILSNYLRSVMLLTPEDLLPSIYLCLNQLAPAYHSLELGMAETYIMKAIGQCTGRTLAQVKSAARTTGDLGLVAEQARATQRTMFPPPPLTLRKVFAALKEVAQATGQASVNKKIGKIQSLYVACRHSEARYLIRSLEGKLRIGLAEQSVLQAIACACAASPTAGPLAGTVDVSADMSQEKFKARVDEFSLIIKTTYCECPNYDSIVDVLLKYGVEALPEHCRLTPGVPLKPMLAHPSRGVADLFTRFDGERFTCEWKYDGERAQIHVPGTESPDLTKASIFSRNQEDNTSKYPDILSRLPKLLKRSVQSCVLDCEAVAYDTANKQILPFQILSTRKRKDAQASEIKVQVCVFVFDLLYLNGSPLVRESLERRRALLKENFNEIEGEWEFARGRDCSSPEEVEGELAEALRGSCEGLMVKALDGDKARYDIARRSHNWLKLKKDYLEGCGDSIDAVVVGGYHGKGKRAGHYGGFLLACYDPEMDAYQTLCKIGTGFSDEDLRTFSETLKAHVIDAPKSYYSYENSMNPDVWFEAACVWEVRCADLSLSPAHRAALGLVDRDKGISLRFPRFIRCRDDKRPEQATSARQVADMYLAQDQVKNTAGNKTAQEDDFY
ncbi:DNA ligase 1 [Pieris rapae]|uniref:DNA ligase 1 n=1 Tax=Pieris rapae TaxID=64459 RepID=UPI001E27A7D3|nr:DNA ligase 1 [Pieris rapae]